MKIGEEEPPAREGSIAIRSENGVLNAITEVRRPEIRRSKPWKHHTAVTLLPVWLCSPAENGISHHTQEELKAIYIERRKKPEEGHVPRK